MTAEVLYRKWRPTTFSNVVGQQAVTHTLSQAVATGRVAHAYLFCGPRGTGKTSTARVLAKAVNCLDRLPEGSEPCGQCAFCRSIEERNFLDLIEIDAASNRGIDEIRSLREKAHFAPAQAATKVYIIDEAHMLTEAAFNAFLKTLEEPPSHTLFVLCTTEPHKLPATIISRCQRFDFRRITTADVVDRLGHIATAEGVELSSEALHLVARAAGGSLRDATNVLDQLITSSGTSPSDDAVREMLGVGGEEQAVGLVQRLLASDTPGALTVINDVAGEGLDLRVLHRMTVEYLRAVLLMKSGVRDAVDAPAEVLQELAAVAPQAGMPRVLRALRLFGGVSLKHDQPSPLPLELATVKLSLELEVAPAVPTEVARPPVAQPEHTASEAKAPLPNPVPVPAVGPAVDQPERTASEAKAPAPNLVPKPVEAQSAETYAVAQPGPEVPEPASRPSISDDRPSSSPSATVEEQLGSQWPAMMRSLSQQRGRRFNVGALLRSSKSRYVDGSVVVFRFTSRSNAERLQEEMEDPGCRMAIERVLDDVLGGHYTVRVEAEENGTNRSGQSQGHLVRAAMNMGGQIVPEGRESDPWEETDDE